MINIFKKEFKRDIWLLYVTLFFLMFINIINRLIQINNYSNDYWKNNEYTNFQAPIMLTGIIAIIISMVIFKYLHSQKQIDLEHSLPITRKDLFLIKYCKGILYFTIPYMITTASLILIDKLQYTDVTVLSIELILFILKYLFVIILVYTFFVLANILTGMTAYSVILGTLAILFVFIFSAMTGSQCNYDSSSFLVNNLNFNQVVGRYFLRDLSYNFYSINHYIFAIVLLIVAIALLLLLSLKLYKDRKSEVVGIPFAFKKLGMFLSIFVVFSISYIIAIPFLELNRTYTLGVISAVICVIIISWIYEIILNNGYKKVKIKRFITTATTSSVLLVLVLGLMKTSYFYELMTAQLNYDEIYYLRFEISDIDGVSNTFTLPTHIDNEAAMSIIEELESQSKVEMASTLRDGTELQEKELGENYWTVKASIIIDDMEHMAIENFYLDKNDTDDIALLNKISSMDTEQSLYNLVYSNYSNIFAIDLNPTFEKYRTLTVINDGVLPYPYFYPTSLDDMGDEFRDAFEKDLALLSESNPQKSSIVFDSLPLTIANYNLLNNVENVYNTIPITTDWKNTLPLVYIPDNNFNVYDISEHDGILEEIERRSFSLSYESQVTTISTSIFDLNSAISNLDYTSFNTDDVINGKVNVQVYTPEITVEAIKEYDLKLIMEKETSKVYFGILEYSNLQ